MRNRMIDIPSNFPIKNKTIDENCQICKEKETMKHLYECKWDNENSKIKYEEIFGKHMKKIKLIYTQFKLKYENREKLTRKLPCDPSCDPLVFGNKISNGNILTN